MQKAKRFARQIQEHWYDKGLGEPIEVEVQEDLGETWSVFVQYYLDGYYLDVQASVDKTLSAPKVVEALRNRIEHEDPDSGGPLGPIVDGVVFEAPRECSPGCAGWAVFEADVGMEIERCDACARFATDQDARDYALPKLEAAYNLVKDIEADPINAIAALIADKVPGSDLADLADLVARADAAWRKSRMEIAYQNVAADLSRAMDRWDDGDLEYSLLGSLSNFCADRMDRHQKGIAGIGEFAALQLNIGEDEEPYKS